MHHGLPARYFDGCHSKRHAVTLTVAEGKLQVHGEAIVLLVEARELSISAPLGSAPRTLTLPGGALLEIDPSPALDALLAELAHRSSRLERLQQHWGVALLALVLVAGLALAAYQSFLPWAARTVAPHIPESLSEQLAADTLRLLDRQMLQASRVDPRRQVALQKGFAELAGTEPRIRMPRLLFRSSPRLGPNALALPDGQIIVLDELLAFSANDEEILAVLAHELGHVRHRHGMRLMLQSSVVSASAALWLGDTSTLAALLGSLVLSSGYSRAMETEADDYALERFRRLGWNGASLAAMLTRLQAVNRDGGQEDGAPGGQLFATHPDLDERIRRLQEISN